MCESIPQVPTQGRATLGTLFSSLLVDHFLFFFSFFIKNLKLFIGSWNSSLRAHIGESGKVSRRMLLPGFTVFFTSWHGDNAMPGQRFPWLSPAAGPLLLPPWSVGFIRIGQRSGHHAQQARWFF